MELEQDFEISEHKEGKAKRFILGFFVSLVIIGIIAGVVWLVSLERAASAPLRTSDAFVHAILNDDVDKAFSLTGEDFRAQTTKEELGERVDAASKGLNKNSLEVTTGEIEKVDRGEVARVYYDLKDLNNKRFKLNVVLLKEKDKGWLVVSATNDVAD